MFLAGRFQEKKSTALKPEQERSFISRLFGGDKNKEKNTFTIRINEADVGRATELVQGMESVKLKKVRDDS